MRIEARTSQRLEQRLLPQMLQSIEVLQLTTVDLLALLDRELQSNEVLDLSPAPEGEVSSGVEVATAAAQREWDQPGVRHASDDVDGRRAFLESQPAPTDSLLDYIRLQVAYRELPAPLAGAVVALAEQLDDRGLLPTSLAAAAAATGHDEELLAEALAELQTFDPPGLAASGAVESMLVQASADPDHELMQRLLREHLEELARNKLPEVARALGIDIDELQALLERMRELTPAPAAPFHEQAEPPLRPDVHAWLVGDEVFVGLAESVPELMVNAAYEALSRDRSQDRSVRAYLREKVRAARELIGAVSMRQATLLRVTQAVMRHQRDFLQLGRVALRPLRMVDLAAELGMHASTVSRAIAGKHVSTQLGVFRLREFFDGGREEPRAPGGVGQARGAVAQRIQDLVAAEDRSHPLSDDALMERLTAQGIAVARRTVSKFRRELGIPSSFQRRRHGGGR